MDRVLGQSEAQKQRLDAQNRLETADDRNGPARVEGQGLPSESRLDGLLGRLVGRHVGRSDVRHSAVQRFHGDLHAPGGDAPEVALEKFRNLPVVLMRNQSHRNLGRRFRRNHRLGPFARVAAPDAVYVERGTHAGTFERRVARLALHVADRERLLVRREAERSPVEGPPFGGSKFPHVVVESGDRHAPLGVGQLRHQTRQHVGRVGHRTAEQPRMEVLVRPLHLDLHVGQAAQAAGDRRGLHREHRGVRDEDHVGLE